ncbi:MAG: hypothetical protein EOO88_46080, partial [Pedobacter sp.]
MKKLLFIACLTIMVIASYAQKQTALGSFNISVVMPEASDELDASHLAKLETKIIRIVEASGVAASGEYSSFVIYPKFDVYQTDLVEGGLQNITVTRCHLSLFIKQVENNLVFSSITKNLNGSGNNKFNALNNAISTLEVNDPSLQKFVETAKSKIIAYYNAHCTSIFASAENMAKKKNFERALILTSIIPEGTSCYNTAQIKTIAYYRSYQKVKCLEEIKAAERVREECRGWSTTEVNDLKCKSHTRSLDQSTSNYMTAKVAALEQSHGWCITSASTSYITMTHLNDLELYFQPSAFATGGKTPN